MNQPRPKFRRLDRDMPELQILVEDVRRCPLVRLISARETRLERTRRQWIRPTRLGMLSPQMLRHRRCYRRKIEQMKRLTDTKVLQMDVLRLMKKLLAVSQPQKPQSGSSASRPITSNLQQGQTHTGLSTRVGRLKCEEASPELHICGLSSRAGRQGRFVDRRVQLGGF